MFKASLQWRRKFDSDTLLRINDVITWQDASDNRTNMAARKKDGAPDWKYYECAETIALFEPVKQYLLKNCKKVITAQIVMPIRRHDWFIMAFIVAVANTWLVDCVRKFVDVT